MAINYLCKNCKTAFSLSHKKCPKCGEAVPKIGRIYRVRVQVNGKRITRVVPGSLELAKEIEAKIKAELVSGEYYDRREKAKQNIKFSEFMGKKYIPYAKENKASWDKEEYLFRVWIAPVMGNKKMENISQFDIEKLKKTMKDAGKAPKTINYAIDVIRMAFNMAIKWGYADKNPAVNIKRPKTDNRRVRFLTKEEANLLLAECKKRSQQLYEIVKLSLYTGMRFGEIANLKWQDVDLENKLIYIKDPKNRTNRVAYIIPEIEDIFTNKKPENLDDFVFKDRNGKKLVYVSKAFDRAVKAAGLNDGVTDPRNKVVFHTLRHTFASWLVMNGTPIYTVKELMGHKTLAMTERYSHLAPDSKREAVEKLSELSLNMNMLVNQMNNNS